MEDLKHKATRLLDIIHSYCGDASSRQEAELKAQARKLYDMFEQHKNPRDLERQATIVKEFLYHMEAGAMTTPHCEDLKHHYEQLRINLRKYE